MKRALRHLGRVDQRVALTALAEGHRISVTNGTLIITRFNRKLYERVKRVKAEKANTNCASQSIG